MKRALGVLPVVLALGAGGLSACVATDQGVDRTWGLGGTKLAAPPPPPPPPPVQEATTVAETPSAPAPGAPGAPLQIAAAPAPETALPDTPEGRAALARRTGDAKAAAALYQQILNDDPDDVDARLGYAHALLDDGRADAATPLTLDLLETRPRDGRVLTLVARLELVRGDLAAAATRLAVAEAQAPASRDVLTVRGMLSDLQGDHAAAQRAYRSALALAPGDMAVQNNLALSMIAADNPAGAASILETIAQDPVAAPVTVRHNLALAYGLMGRQSEAVRLLTLDLDRDRVDENLAYYSWLREQRQAPVAADRAPAPAAAMPLAAPPAGPAVPARPAEPDRAIVSR